MHIRQKGFAMVKVINKLLFKMSSKRKYGFCILPRYIRAIKFKGVVLYNLNLLVYIKDFVYWVNTYWTKVISCVKWRIS